MKQRIRAVTERVLRVKYFNLNQLDRKLEKYVGCANGYFVEFSDIDSVTQSNSLYLERHRGWCGLLVEPTPHKFLKCRKKRAARSRVRFAARVSLEYEQGFVRTAYSNLGSDITAPVAHAKLGRRFPSARKKVVDFGAVERALNDLSLTASAPVLREFPSHEVGSAEREVLDGLDHERFGFKHLLIGYPDFPRLDNHFIGQGFTFVEKLSGEDYLFKATGKGGNGALPLDGET